MYGRRLRRLVLCSRQAMRALSDWADGKAFQLSCVAGGPLGGDRLEVRPEGDYQVDG